MRPLQHPQNEVNGLSLRIACIAGNEGLEAPEPGRFSDEVLGLQGRVDPKISSPLSEILFHNYRYKYSIPLEYYCNYTANMNTIPHEILPLTHIYTCSLVKRNRTSHPRILAHGVVISHLKLGPRDRQVVSPKSSLRDKRQLSRSALISLDKFALSISSRMHKSSEFVSPIGSPDAQVEQGLAAGNCEHQVFVGLTCLDLADNPAKDLATQANARKPRNARYPKSTGVHFGIDREIRASRSQSRILADRCAGSGMGWHRPGLLGFRGAGRVRPGCHEASGAPEGWRVRGRFALVQPRSIGNFSGKDR